VAKRIFLTLLLMMLTAGGAFAQFSLSAGVGGFGSNDFGGGYKRAFNDWGDRVKMPYFGGGGYAFFDAYFVELALGVYGGELNWRIDGDGRSLSFIDLRISLFGKYPIPLTRRLTVFPLLGVDYALTIAAGFADGLPEYDWWLGASEYPHIYHDVYHVGTDEDETIEVDAGYFSALWFKAGVGLDYSITRRIYLRFAALYGIRLANKYENGAKDFYTTYTQLSFTALPGHGVDARVALGFRF